jgi:hypothetical protein
MAVRHDHGGCRVRGLRALAAGSATFALPCFEPGAALNPFDGPTLVSRHAEPFDA